MSRSPVLRAMVCAAGGLGLVAALPAAAQPSPADPVDALTHLDSDQEVGPPAPPDRFDTVLRGFSTSLEASETESKTSIALGGSLVATTVRTDARSVQDALLWKLGTDYSFGGKSDLTDDATLDLMQGGVKLSAGVTWMHSTSDSNYLVDRRFEELRAEAIAACKTRNPGDLDACAALNSELIAPGPIVQTYLPAKFRQIQRELVEPFYTLGASVSVGIREFDYTLPGVFTDEAETRVSPSFKLTGVLYPGDGVSAAKVEVEYGNVWQSVDETIVCRTVIADPSADCKKASPTSPEREEALILRGEYRRFFPLASLAEDGIGIAPMLSVDALTGDVGAEFPIFYKRGRNSPIQPGVTIGYRKDASKADDADEEVVFSLFLKTTFGL